MAVQRLGNKRRTGRVRKIRVVAAGSLDDMQLSETAERGNEKVWH